MMGLDTLVAAVASAYEGLAASAHPGARMAGECARRLRVLDAGGALAKPHPNRVPVADRMPAIIAAAGAGPAAAIARSLAPVLPSVDWVQTYSEAQLGRTYIENYGYFDIASPKRGLIATEEIACGFLVIGPGQLYPAHRHPAVELYHVVAGTPDWRVDDAPWETKPAGSFVFHPSLAIHAMRTNEAPLLALYAWLGDLETSAVLIS
jgi:quercetin dioxygenase-like cupin family protein